jgi:Protein of unknown function (DUF 659)/hAT family C-terminal dimerisation region
MSNAGRKQDPIWGCYIKLPNVTGKTGSRAKCKDCGAEMQGLVVRLKDHMQKCKGGADDEQLPDFDNGIATTATGQQQGQSASTHDSATTSSDMMNDMQEASTSGGIGRIDTTSTGTRVKPEIDVQTLTRPTKVRCLDNFVTKTTRSEKEILDEQIARFVYATNSSFRIVEHEEFKKTVQLLRPGYTPPSRWDVAGKLLNTVHAKCLKTGKELLQGKTVCMSLDGWSNVHNEPIICATVTSNSDIYLVDTIDTSGHAHDAGYLSEVAVNAVKKCETTFCCYVRSFVTDNAANMAKMRKELQEREDVDVVTYGCSAHLMNLLAKDLEIENIKEHVVRVTKYFRNNHLAAAAYKSTGGLRLIMPQEVRWNTMADCLETYISQWPKLMAVCEQNRDEIDKDISNIVTNIGVKRSAEELLQRLKPIAVALDSVQRDSCNIAEAVEIWKKLKSDLPLESRDSKKKFQKRFDQALSPYHFLANIIHPQYRGKNLTDAEYDTGMSLAAEEYAASVPDLINYKAEAVPFQRFMFEMNVLDTVKPVDWWKSLSDRLNKQTVDLASQLVTATASSAGVERVFSSFGLVQSTLRNRLGSERAGKLVFLFKLMNNKPAEGENEHSYNE